ncbi:MAG: DUF2145 domain-containing protein [Alphaproteobacteria bacterium]|nr:DUF2145 domain-containing protein [Alphaproteobacteria bacterium]
MIRTLVATVAFAGLAGCGTTASAPVQGNASAPLADSGFSGRAAGAHLTGEQATAFGKQIERELASKGARLAIVFRTGRPRDELPDGIAYTHGAFWVYVPITLDDGRQINGYAVYNLYHGDGKTLAKDKSYLHQDFPVDFVAATAVDDVAVIIPSPEMQRRVVEIMGGPTYEALHVEDYSLVSNPLDPKYQNCNEFMLDVLASAAWETTEMAQIKANLRQHYKPTKVKTSLIERTLGPIADSRLKTDDQRGGIVTATYESMSAFMTEKKLLTESYVLQRAP